MQKRIYFLDYMKAISVLMVIITHIDWAEKNLFQFLFIINMAVPIFMIISGFNFDMSYTKRIQAREATLGRPATIWEQLQIMYSPANLWPRIVRFATPFIPIAILEWILKSVAHVEVSVPRLFLLGGFGPGSYYVPLLFELLAIFPIIYLLVKAHPYIGMMSVAFFQFAYEAWVAYSGFEKYWYRLLIFRYLLLIAFGCFLHQHPDKRLHKRTIFSMFVIGAEYLLLYHMGIKFSMFRFWSPTVLPADFYIMAVMVVLFRLFYHSRIPGRFGTLMETIGKASYHIFLIQMVYYHFDLGGPIFSWNYGLQIICNILITVSIGIGYFYLENFLRKKFKERRA